MITPKVPGSGPDGGRYARAPQKETGETTKRRSVKIRSDSSERDGRDNKAE
jgi:hypothetical protein